MEAAAVGASTIGALALGPIGLVGGFFVKGKDVSLPAGSTLYIETQEAVTTKGLELTSGAPNAVIRKRVVRSAAADTETAKAAADNEVKETETAASAPVAKAEEKAEAKANDTSTAINEKAKAELESVGEKDTEKAAAKTDSSSEETPSVVIVRND